MTENIIKTQHLITAVIILSLFSGIGIAAAEKKKSAKEAWVGLLEERYRKSPIFAYVENNPALPNVLIYGDSISIGYTQSVRKKLKDRVNVYRLYRNGRHTGVFIEYMTRMHKTMRDPALDDPWTFEWDVIHFNVGLHDLWRSGPNAKQDPGSGTHRIPIPAYKKNLKGIVDYLIKMAPKAKLIFATTTPVPNNTPNRLHGDANAYNRAAREVLKSYPDILINDLYEFTRPHQPEWWAKPGDVHCNPAGRKAQGEEVARVILSVLEERKKTTKKRTGLIVYSDDLTHIVNCDSPYNKRGEPFTEAKIYASVDEVADAGADIHMLQPGLGWVPLWKSNILAFAENYAWVKKRYGTQDGKFDAYMLKGGDIVAAFVKRCRERGIQPYISLRMNDYHMKELIDFTREEIKRSSKPVHSLSIYASRFQTDHKDWRLRPDPEGLDTIKEAWKVNKDRGLRVRTRRARVLNWAIPAVRQHKLAFITELCENYDIDGFEMDFMRTAHLFRKEETTSEQRLEIMTDYCRKVRQILDRSAPEGKRRRLCVRIPHHIPAHDEMGIDIAAWHAAGVDMFNLSCHYVNQQQTALAELLKRAPNAEFFMELTQTTKRLDKKIRPFIHRMTTREQFTTSAAVAAAEGASGVSLFNFMYYRAQARPINGVRVEPPFEVFRMMKQAMLSPPTNQHYYFSKISDVWGVGGSPVNKHVRMNQPGSFRLTMTSPKGGWKQSGRLRIQTTKPITDSTLKVAFNGKRLTRTDDISDPFPSPYNQDASLSNPEILRAWTVPANQMKNGENTLVFTLTNGSSISIAYIDLGIVSTIKSERRIQK